MSKRLAAVLLCGSLAIALAAWKGRAIADWLLIPDASSAITPDGPLKSPDSPAAKSLRDAAGPADRRAVTEGRREANRLDALGRACTRHLDLEGKLIHTGMTWEEAHEEANLVLRDGDPCADFNRELLPPAK